MEARLGLLSDWLLNQFRRILLLLLFYCVSKLMAVTRTLQALNWQEILGQDAVESKL